MIREDVELVSLDEMAEVFNSKIEIDCQELSVKGTVFCLCWIEFSGEVNDWLPFIVLQLLKDCSYCSI